ncbi:MAG: homoserine dehydrogenase [Lachnospiraceae bacterium]|nr:homoserine dehydrogenase [Lachnospiraceae bacterium]
MIHVAVMGHGTVGSGVVEIIDKNKKEVDAASKDEVCVKYILDLRDFPGDPHEDLLIKDYKIIVDDPEVDIVVEALGGIDLAYKYTKEALLNGKSVVTSNKAVVAEHGVELLKIAKEKNCSYLFEASVGGGIPILRPLNTSFRAERIEGITGILNGTTNFMLTKMDEEGCDYDDVLKEAQSKGYAEKNPEADVCGYDACRKIAILTSLSMGKTVHYQNITTEGITNINKVDFEYAKKMGASVKLLGLSRNLDGECMALVAPFMVSDKSPLYAVRGVFNAVMVRGNMLGDTLFYGQGAGKLATASAIVSDIVDCSINKGKTIECTWKDEEAVMADDSKKVFNYFIRVKKEAFDNLVKSVGIKEKVVVESVSDEIGFVSDRISEDKFLKAKEICSNSIINYIRILDM